MAATALNDGTTRDRGPTSATNWTSQPDDMIRAALSLTEELRRIPSENEGGRVSAKGWKAERHGAVLSSRPGMARNPYATSEAGSQGIWSYVTEL